MNRLSLLLVVFMTALSFIGSSQTINSDQITEKWTLVTKENGVIIYLRKEACKVGPLEKPLVYVFYKIENTNADAKNVYFQAGLKYDQECIGCNGEEESSKAINVLGNTSVECDNTFAKGLLSSLITNPNYPDSRVFESVMLLDIKID